MSNRGKQEIMILPFQPEVLVFGCGGVVHFWQFIELGHNVGFFGWPYAGSLGVHCSANDNCIS